MNTWKDKDIIELYWQRSEEAIRATAAKCGGYCAALCEVEGCVEAGRHTHDNVIYCGYAHENGYCDNTCAAILAAQEMQSQFVQAWSGWGCWGGGHRGWHC